MLDGIKPGETWVRRDVHAKWGGRQQGGIGPSSKAPVVLFFTDPVSGRKHGYYDGWDEDGLFNYVGEGQQGDQRLVQGNKAILNHLADGRTLEGFQAKGSSVTYLGEFELVDYHFTDAPESGRPEVLRQVVVFRLRLKNDAPVDLPHNPFTAKSEPVTDVVPVEEVNTESAFVTPDREPYEMERREALLVRRYREHLMRQGHEVNRLRVVPAGESAPLFSDLWDVTEQELIEAKGTTTRESVRMAVAQLHDYGRFVEHNRKTLLVPAALRPDLTAFVQNMGISIVFPDGDDWVRQG